MRSFIFMGISICTTIVITSIFSMLVPNCKMEKLIKFALSLFFLIGMVSPFLSLDFHIDFDLKPYQDISLVSQDKFISLATRNIEASLEKVLINYKIDFKKIEVIVNKTESSDISINKVIIHQVAKCDCLKAKDILTKETGIVPQVIEKEG